jgi:hypothetical protein
MILKAGIEIELSFLILYSYSSHLFISPAITINYHFFYNAFIYITERRASNLVS